MLSRPPRVSPDLAMLGLVVIWGANFSLVKALLAEFEALAFNAVRFGFGSLVLVPFVLRGTGLPRFTRREWPALVGLGLVGNTLYQILFIKGIDWTLAGNAALILAVSPVLVTMLSSWLKHEDVRPAGWAGVALSVVGIGLVLAESAGVRFAASTLRGDLTILASAVAWAVYTVGAGPLVRRHGALPVTAVTMWIGATGFLVASTPSIIRQDWGAPPALAWGGLFLSGTLAVGLAYVIWYHGVQHLGNTRTAVFSNAVPVVALITAWLALGETPGALQVVGAVFIVGGVLLTRLRGTRECASVVAR